MKRNRFSATIVQKLLRNHSAKVQLNLGARILRNHTAKDVKSSDQIVQPGKPQLQNDCASFLQYELRITFCNIIAVHLGLSKCETGDKRLDSEILGQFWDGLKTIPILKIFRVWGQSVVHLDSPFILFFKIQIIKQRRDLEISGTILGRIKNLSQICKRCKEVKTKDVFKWMSSGGWLVFILVLFIFESI